VCDLPYVPEGDTIHHLAIGMRPILLGRVPEEIRAPQPRHSRERWAERLAGMAVTSVDALGKHLFVRFDGGLTVHSHLRMSGTWGIHRKGSRWRRPAHRAWLLLRCEGWELVQFDGPLLQLERDARLRRDPGLRLLGQDILGESFDLALAVRRFRREDPHCAIGDALLNQRNVAGIGNVWKAEACHAAGIDPRRPVCELTDQQITDILDYARTHMQVCANTGPRSRPGAVYRRAGLPCPRCGERVRQSTLGEHNRVTFWCPGCQR
jgi:endonuclease VIII